MYTIVEIDYLIEITQHNMKRYITYNRVQTDKNNFIDPNTNNSFENATEGSTFYETCYNLDGVFLAYVEYPDNTTQWQIDWLLEEYSAFNFTFITEEEANTHLSKIWDISVKDFIFTDKRIFDLI